MTKKKIVVIGGGVAGLSTGIYAAMNGFDTEIIEMHSVAGGQCTAWERKKYRFDYCLHWLVGTANGPFHEIWKETHVLNEQTEIIDHDIHSRIVDSEGKEFFIYSNIDRWEKYLIEMAPEDEKSIRKMCVDMRKSALLEPFQAPPELRNMFTYLRILPKMMPVFNVVRKFGRLSCEEYFDKLNFTNPKIKSILFELYGGRNFSALAFIFMLGWFHQKNAGYIKGGSYPFAQRMLQRFEQLGGTITYKKRVEKIVVESNRAKGVILNDGTRIDADYVVSAADGFTTLYKMLEGKYVSKQVDHAYKKWDLFTPLVQVSFGINKAIPSEEPITLYNVKDIKIGQTELANGFSLMNYSFDPTMAPEGKTTLVMRYESPWNLWKDLEGEAYKNEKIKIEQDALACIEKVYPGISAYVEVVDVATPKTDVRYTGVKDGAYEGFMPTRENMMKSLKMNLPRLRNFYMAGQWLYPGGGLPPSAQSGKFAVMLICKNEKKPFIVR
ncbi:MAG TPA: NAD(P)/FAD-dependent oxidoreductase [Prolixibacteraceae bacterium]|nr:NAD(P)/FAD-dependent oxidoreductase [Prolixibacteraceae bacterium]